MKNAEDVTFGGGGLDRAAHMRAAPPTGDVLPFWRGKPLLKVSNEERGPRSPRFLEASDVVFDHSDEPAVFLGLDETKPLYARDVSAWEPEENLDEIGAFIDMSEQWHPGVEDASFAELRANMTRLTPRGAEIVATAKAILEWHRSHQFCAKCGAKSNMAMAGWQRDCPACSAHHFPRTDPVAIMLITHGNSVLMGRSPGWPEGMYSLLAGFVEPGETIEAAVRREVFEEAGVKVGEVTYLSSQPWPFPSSLMFGCAGKALSKDINIDPVEIEDALWVTREDMMLAFQGEHPAMKPARKGAIARFLLERWLADTLD